MTYEVSNGHVIDDVTWLPKVLWGSTVGCHRDSLASCVMLSSRIFITRFGRGWVISGVCGCLCGRGLAPSQCRLYLSPCFKRMDLQQCITLQLAVKCVYCCYSHWRDSLSANNFSHIAVLFQGTLEMFGGIGLMIGPPIGGALFEVLLIYM